MGKVFDLRTSSANTSAEWICDGPYSWSEPALFCGTSLWASDARIAGGQSHAVITAAQEATISDTQISSLGVAILANLTGTGDSVAAAGAATAAAT